MGLGGRDVPQLRQRLPGQGNVTQAGGVGAGIQVGNVGVSVEFLLNHDSTVRQFVLKVKLAFALMAKRRLDTGVDVYWHGLDLCQFL